MPGMYSRLSVVLLVVAIGSCGGDGAKTGRPFHALPALGARLLVLAPHPDDEVLGAAGVIDAAVHRGAEVRVVVATDGEVGPDKSHAGGALARERRDETRHALADLGVGANAVTFLGYADGSLAEAWSERWTARKRSQERQPADAVVDDLRAALRAATPDSIILPMPLDTHPDHAALNRWARGVTIRVPRGDCVVDAGAGDRLRMRFIRAASVEERLVRLEGGAVTVRGGMPGGPLAPASDVVISTSPRSVRLVLAPEA